MEAVDKVLAEFGLSAGEAKVWRAALAHEETGPYELARETGIPRTTVYELLTGLALKGLVEVQRSDGFSKRQTKVRAKNPSVLREKIFEKREELTKLEVDVVQILPELKGQYLQRVPNADFKFYPGVDGAKEVYRKMYLEETEAAVVAWDCLMPMDMFGKDWMNELVNEINALSEKRHQSRRSIVPMSSWTQHVISYQYERDKRYLGEEFRMLDNPGFKIYQDMHVQGSVVYVVNGLKEEAWGLAMRSELLADTFRSMFEVMWQAAKPVSEEMVRGWGPNRFLAEERSRRKA